MPAKFGFKIQLALARGETFFFFKEKHCCVSYFLKKISVGFFYLIPYLRKQCTAAPQITLKPLSRALKRLLPSVCVSLFFNIHPRELYLSLIYLINSCLHRLLLITQVFYCFYFSHVISPSQKGKYSNVQTLYLLQLLSRI